MALCAVFPGTFDPIHFGHIDIANRGCRIFDELVIAVYDRPLKELCFSPDERLDMVTRAFVGNNKVTVVGYSVLTVDFCRSRGAEFLLRGLRVFSDFEHEFRMALANRRLDATIDTISLITSEEHTFLNSTTVREIASLGGDVSSMVPEAVRLALTQKFSDPTVQQSSIQSSLRD